MLFTIAYYSPKLRKLRSWQEPGSWMQSRNGGETLLPALLLMAWSACFHIASGTTCPAVEPHTVSCTHPIKYPTDSHARQPSGGIYSIISSFSKICLGFCQAWKKKKERKKQHMWERKSNDYSLRVGQLYQPSKAQSTLQKNRGDNIGSRGCRRDTAIMCLLDMANQLHLEVSAAVVKCTKPIPYWFISIT